MMAQFEFRLATLLKLRELARDERQLQFVEALRLMDQVRLRCFEIDVLLHETRRRLAPEAGELDADRLLNATRYELVLRAEQRALKAQEASLTAEMEKRREALVAANREVRSLELLREKQLLRHRDDQERLARNEFDEIAARRYAGEDAE